MLKGASETVSDNPVVAMILKGLHFKYKPFVTVIVHQNEPPRPGSVAAEDSLGMWAVGGSIPDCVKQKTLKFEVLLLCLALSTK